MSTETTENHRQMTEVRALRMLRAGDSIKDVAQATGLTADELSKLQRDFPSSTQQVPQRIGTATPVQQPTRPDLSRATIPPAATVVPGGGPLTIAQLLEVASGHSNARIRNAGKVIEERLDQLRQQIRDLAAEEAAKQKVIEEQAKARADVARLEQQLAAAKAKLKGQKKSSTGWTPERRAQAAANATHISSVPTDCPSCGRTFGHAGAMGNHKKTCTGTSS